jgi:hypothetical protein
MANEITKAQAIESLMPTADWTLLGDTELLWTDSEQTEPTALAITTERERLQAVYDSQAYARNRKAEYDQLNQFEMQFDDDRDSTTTWVDKINEIKGRHPK